MPSPDVLTLPVHRHRVVHTVEELCVDPKQLLVADNFCISDLGFSSSCAAVNIQRLRLDELFARDGGPVEHGDLCGLRAFVGTKADGT